MILVNAKGIKVTCDEAKAEALATFGFKLLNAQTSPTPVPVKTSEVTTSNDKPAPPTKTKSK